MDWFLKWYYWYKNLWDEILFFWVANYIFSNFDIKNLYVYVQDINWFENWIWLNKRFLDVNIERIKPTKKSRISNWIYFFWWWEVLSEQRAFPYDWRNLIFRYPTQIFNKNFIILWWIWTPNKFHSKILYNLILRNSKKIIVRENTSFEICKKYNSNCVLLNDFSIDIFDKRKSQYIGIDQNTTEKKYILINLNKYIFNKNSVKEIVNFCKKNKELVKYYIPFDLQEDYFLYKHLKEIIDDLILYDWNSYDINNIFKFMNKSEWWIGARLHFLLILKFMNKNIIPLYYQEKIKKFFYN